MRHIPDGVLRRLDDEPLAVADTVIEHASSCARCAARRAEIAEDTEVTARLLSGAHSVPDADLVWARLRREMARDPAPSAGLSVTPPPSHGHRAVFPRVSLRGALMTGVIGVVVAGTAAAATLTNVFAPTHVAPVSVSRSDVRALTAFLGFDDRQVLGGLPAGAGLTRVRFGTIRWVSAGAAHPAGSLAEATAEAGFPVRVPLRVPAGVGTVERFLVAPRVSATVTFDSTAARVGGSTVTLDAGPVVLAQYAAANSAGLPTLGVAAMRRPTAHSSGATLSEIEAFLLAQPGVPVELAEEVRLLGNLSTTLPVPVPSGAAVRSVAVAGWPGVLLTDSSKAAGAVVWEDGQGIVHAVAGILDSRDLLDVARQVG